MELHNIGFATTVFNVAITKGRELIGTREVDISNLPPASLYYLMAYGLKQSLNDAHASAKDLTEALASVDKRLQKILDGTMGERATREALDPIEAEAIKLASDKVRQAMRAKGIKPADHKEKVAELAAQLVEKDPAFREEARRRIENAKEIDVLGMLDFADLGADNATEEDSGEEEEGEEGDGDNANPDAPEEETANA